MVRSRRYCFARQARARLHVQGAPSGPELGVVISALEAGSAVFHPGRSSLAEQEIRERLNDARISQSIDPQKLSRRICFNEERPSVGSYDEINRSEFKLGPAHKG